MERRASCESIGICRNEILLDWNGHNSLGQFYRNWKVFHFAESLMLLKLFCFAELPLYSILDGRNERDKNEVCEYLIWKRLPQIFVLVYLFFFASQFLFSYEISLAVISSRRKNKYVDTELLYNLHLLIKKPITHRSGYTIEKV